MMSDDLRRELLLTEAALLGHKASLQRWKREEAEGKDVQRIGLARHQAAAAQTKIRKGERKLAGLKIRISTVEDAEIREDENVNRNTLHEPAMVPPSEIRDGWTLRAKRTLNLNGRVYRPGSEILADDLAAMLNSQALLKGGHVGWVPPHTPRPSRPPPPPVVAQPIAPTDHVEVLRAAMRESIASGRVQTMRQALDRADRDLVSRATKQFADTVRVVETGAFGQSHKTVSGRDSRRVVDGFAEHVIAETSPSPSTQQQEARAS